MYRGGTFSLEETHLAQRIWDNKILINSEASTPPPFLSSPSREGYFGTSSENCQLSTLAASSILSQDLTSDRDWTIFEKQFGGDDCDAGGASSGGSGGETANDE